MNPFHRLVRILSVPGLLAIVLTPLLVGALVFALTPRILAAKEGATATIDTYPVVKTRASYEVATSMSDFGTLYMGAATEAAAASGQDAAAASPLLTATRTEDSALAQVGFQAPTSDGAKAGLRAAARHALTTMANSALTKANLDVNSAAAERGRAVAAMSQAPGSDRYAAASRRARLTAADEALSSAYLAQADARASIAGIPALVDGARVDVATVSSTSDALRITLAAAATSFIVALLAVAFLRRRHFAAARSGSGL